MSGSTSAATSKSHRGVRLDLALAVALIASISVNVAAGSSTASAHTAALYFTVSWGDQDWIIGNIAGGDLAIAGAQTAMQAADNPWNAASGVTFDFVFEFEDSGQIYDANPCDQAIPGANVGIYGVGLGSTIGLTELCTQGSGIVEATIALDETSRPWDSTNPICATCYDLFGALTHEFGHAMGGWMPAAGGHWTGSTLCPSNSGRHTMCASMPTGINWYQSLGTHDIHTAAGWY